MNFSIVNKFIAVLIVLACFAFSFSIFFTDFLAGEPYRVQGNQRIILGSIMLLYSVFRGIRLYRDVKRGGN